ncbi:MAG: type II toxin-antitoxin system VapC family toxin [Terracidiphilus sp.]
MSAEFPAHGYLLDTHTAIFSMSQSKSLSAAAKATVALGQNFLSVVSYWEVMVKSMKGTLEVGDPRLWWQEALEQLAATPLVLRPQHIAAVYSLPPIHKDPFDRMLIAQATVEGLALVTTDGEMARYASESLRVVG